MRDRLPVKVIPLIMKDESLGMSLTDTAAARILQRSCVRLISIVTWNQVCLFILNMPTLEGPDADGVTGTGTGSDRRRKDHMKEYVRRQEIFLKLPARFKMDYDVIINTAFADLERKLNEEVRNITRDLGGVIAVEGEVPEARRELGLAQRVRDVVSRLQAQVNEAHLILNRLRGRTTRSA